MEYEGANYWELTSRAWSNATLDLTVPAKMGSWLDDDYLYNYRRVNSEDKPIRKTNRFGRTASGRG